MPDNAFEDMELAALYDLFAPSGERGDFGLYLPMVMTAGSVLDVGCGTGSFLHMARERGHTGRLTGLDPASGMIARARQKRTDIEWVQGDLSDVSWVNEFDLVVMSGHAFQVFMSDDEVRAALSVISRSLSKDGRFAFETRNPLAREWEQWHDRYSGKVADSSGSVVEGVCTADQPLSNGIVKFHHAYTSPDWSEPKVSHSTLRFLDTDELDRFLTEAGLQVAERYGNWDRSPLTDTSPEIITVASRV